MSDALLIGIDAGTSVIKAVAFDLDGRQVAQASRRNSYVTLPNGGVEQDMRRTWADTAAVLRELGETIDRLAQRVVALGVTGQGDGTWLIGAQGQPVHDAWLWLDARASAEAAELGASDGIDVIFENTGTGVNVCQMRSQLLWMVRHAPDLVLRAGTAFHCKDWLYFNLTGVRATDPTEGVLTFGDYRTRDYSTAVIDALGLTDLRHLLPEIVDGARDFHPLSDAAARTTGLPAGLPVSLGYIDIACTALGAGIHDPASQVGLTILGSTGVHMRFVPDADSVDLNAGRTGYTLALPGQAFAQLQTNMAATLNIDWVFGLEAEILKIHGITPDPGSIIDGFDRRVMKARPGRALYHPYISAAGERGPFTDPMARASLTGLCLDTSWDDILRGVCDGLVLSARDCYTAMGAMPGEVRLTGGGAKSSALRSLLASALNTPVRAIAQDEAGAAGAVMIAALAQGHFSDATAATDAWIGPLLGELEQPDPSLIETYDALFEAYDATRVALSPAWRAQAQARERLL